MILRALEQSQAVGSGKPRRIWDAIEQSQLAFASAGERGASAVPREQSARAKSLAAESWNETSCWLVTQPAHSALSGDIAAKLSPEVFGVFDEATIRAIALHDAGWSGFDSELIRASRSQPVSPKAGETRVGHPKHGKSPRMVSFISAPPKEVADAWTGSVETALKASPLGGFLVSEHFRTIAQMQGAQMQSAQRQSVGMTEGKPDAAKRMAKFIAQEEARQRKLRPKILLDDDAVERLVDGLRFCDLLSLYLCAGLTEAVEFPQQIQQLTPILQMTAEDTFALQPSPFSQEEIFSFSALRHPRTKSVSSATFLCKITG